MIARLSNFELLRIICMLMIVAGHIVLKHETTYSLSDNNEIIRLFSLSMFSVAVNTFVLISGYFGIVFKRKRFFKLLLQTLFYSVFLLFVSILIGWHSFNIHKDIYVILPILTKQYWFITCYIILYVISSWLNKLISCLRRSEYFRFLILGFIIIYVWPTFSYLFKTEQFINDSGYGIVNFAYLYMLGRYVNLYYDVCVSSIFYFFGYFCTTFLLFICQCFLSWILGFEFTSWISYNTLFIFVGAICLFMAFKNLKFESASVNFWAKPCLAVYLIHMNPYIWGNLCGVIGVSEYRGFKYILLIFILPIIIYFVCVTVEIIRTALLEKFEEKIINILGRLTDSLITLQ